MLQGYFQCFVYLTHGSLMIGILSGTLSKEKFGCELTEIEHKLDS